MPYFTADGPNVPDELVQDLEDDRVVLFCGAGISMDAGLPSYIGLVAKSYEEMGIPAPAADDPQWQWPDRLLGELEVRCVPGAVRQSVVRQLDRPPKRRDYHGALLRLARLKREPVMRLVTTNFDRYFEAAYPALTPGIDLHSGPILPIPRDDRVASWRSVVHLHGRLEPTPHPNDHLVLTSADFGRAYLTDRWAARFVARLFADFVVLFVGYSLNDPVLRYMTDAFAAEAAAARRHSSRPPAYIFVPHTGTSPPSASLWQQRGMEPIFYDSEPDHHRLRETLLAWAKAREDWLSSTTAIVSRLGPFEPRALTPSDTSNLYWAIAGQQQDGGLGARTFATLKSPPPIAWIAEFQQREEHALSIYKGESEKAAKLGRPAPPMPLMPLNSLIVWPGNSETPLSRVAIHLCEWIARHLETYEAVDWVAEQTHNGQRLHSIFRGIIRDRLKETTELRSSLALFWRIVSSEGIWASRSQDATHMWELQRNLVDRSINPDGRAEVLSLLRPYLRLSPSSWRKANWPDVYGITDPEERAKFEDRFSMVAEAEVDLVGGHTVRLLIDAINNLPDPDAFLADVVDDITSLLKTALDLWAIVEEANQHHDPGDFHRRSIRPHPQNHGFYRWTQLIDLLWKGWRRIDAQSKIVSRRCVERWRGFSYPTFRRLVLQALSESRHWTPEEKLEILINGTG